MQLINSDGRGDLARIVRSRGFVIALVALVVLAVAGTTAGYAALNKTITLSVDGEERTVSAFNGTVGDVLEDEGVEVGDRDRVVPSVDEAVEDGTKISVRYARPLELTVDGATETHWVLAADVDSALAELGLRAEGAQLSASRSASIGRDGLALDVVTPKTLTIVVGAEQPVQEQVAAVTVADVLAELDITLGEADSVVPAAETPVAAGDQIVVTRWAAEQATVTGEVVPHGTVEVPDDTMFEGDEEVEVEGRDGTADVTYLVVLRNGSSIGSRELERVVTQAPVTERVRVGTKEEPVEEAPASSGSGSNPPANFAGGSTVWDQLAQCESGGNWSINTGNGYYGGLQFNAQTWRAYGGTGLPHQNSREEQIRIATKLRDARGGYGAWPGCSSKLGLPR